MNPGNIGYFSVKGSVIVLLLRNIGYSMMGAGNHYGNFSFVFLKIAKQDVQKQAKQLDESNEINTDYLIMMGMTLHVCLHFMACLVSTSENQHSQWCQARENP